MDPVNGLSQIMQILRKQFSEKPTKSKKSNTKPDTAETTDNLAHARINVEQLEVLISSRIKSLRIDDPDYQQKAIMIFVESVLTWEFGEKLLSDPGFTELTQKIYDAFQYNEALSNKFKSLLINYQ